MRTGDPIDDEEDLALPHWAGVVPLSIVVGAPYPAENLAGGVELPAAMHGRYGA